MSYASIEEAWGVQSLSPKAVQEHAPGRVPRATRRAHRHAERRAHPPDPRPTMTPRPRPGSVRPARAHVSPAAVRDYLADAYRVSGAPGVTRLLHPRALADIRRCDRGWTRDPDKLMWALLGVFAVLALADQWHATAPTALPPW